MNPLPSPPSRPSRDPLPSANLEQIEANLAEAVREFNEAFPPYCFDFTGEYQCHARALATMQEIATGRSRPDIAARLAETSAQYFAALNAQHIGQAKGRWASA